MTYKPVADVPDEVRKWYSDKGKIGGMTVTPRKLAALAKLRKRRKQLRRERSKAQAGTIEAGSIQHDE